MPAASFGDSSWILPNMPLLCNISIDGLSFVGKKTLCEIFNNFWVFN
jgi:hypothetical protein